MNKTEWLEKVAHIHARDAAWFFLFCLAIIGVSMWLDMRKDKQDAKRNETRIKTH